MPAPTSFDYAVVRVVPRVERAEFINAGVLLFCLSRDALVARVALDRPRLHALCATADADAIASHLAAIERICRGEGDIGKLSQRERFQWLTAPRSTVVQLSPVHSGVCTDPAEALDRLFQSMVGG